MRVKLTDTAIRSYQPRAAQYSVGDAACPGLCVRITPKGIKSFAFAYRNRTTRKVEWLTLGRYPDVPLTKAREIANDARKAVANGETPIAAKVRHVEAERAVMTYAKVVALYYDAHLSTLRTGRNIRTTLERIGRLYRWNERPIASISDDEAAIVLSDIAERRGKKRMANQAKHLLHAMLKWAKQPGRKFVTINPFSDLPAPGGPVVTRERFLSAEEIRQVWRALDDPKSLGIKPDAATALRLILTTAARPRHGARHGRHRTARPKRTWPALVVARRADESKERVRHAALRSGARTRPAASQDRCAHGAVRPAALLPRPRREGHRCSARHGTLDAARPEAHCCNDPRPIGLLARTDRRATRTYSKA
jgi:Arm DNA-binding domain